MYVVVNSLNEDFSHFALEHWRPFQESLFRYFGHQCHGAYCVDPAPHSPVVPPPSPRSGSSSSPVPSLESCSSGSDGGAHDEEEGAQESHDSFRTALSSIEQGASSAHEVESGSVGFTGSIWVCTRELSSDGGEEGDGGQFVPRRLRMSRVLGRSSNEDLFILSAERV